MTEKWLLFRKKIHNHYGALSGKERHLADYVMENPEKIMNSVVSDIAREAGVSSATVVRFCRSCGYSGLSDLKLQLKREYEREHQLVNVREVQKGDPLPVIKQKVLSYHMNVVHAVLSGWNEEAYNYAADELLAAKNILIISSGGSKAAAVSLTDILCQLGLPCDFLGDSSFDMMRIQRMEPGDVVVGIQYTGRFLSTTECIRFARSRGVTTISITGFLDSPVMEYTDIVLNSNLAEEDGNSSLAARIAETVVVEILYSVLISRAGKKMENFGQPSEVLEHLRIGPSAP